MVVIVGGLIVLIGGFFWFSNWFESKFQIPYAIEYAEPARDSLKVAHGHVSLLSLENDSLLQLSFRLVDKIKSDSLVNVQQQKSIKELNDFKKATLKAAPCWKYPLIGKRYLIDCQTELRLY